MVTVYCYNVISVLLVLQLIFTERVIESVNVTHSQRAVCSILLSPYNVQLQWYNNPSLIWQ